MKHMADGFNPLPEELQIGSHQEQVDKFFAKADENSDGMIDRQELINFFLAEVER